MTYLIIFAVIFLISLQKITQDSLSHENTTALRGILAVGIILHHIASWYPFSNFFASIGSVICAVFFLLSGYALKVSVNKNRDYAQTIIRKKIPALVLEYAIVFILTAIFLFIDKGSIADIAAGIKDISRGLTLVPFSWFIIAIIYFYLAFYLACKFHNSTAGKAFLLALTLAYIILLKLIGFPDYWYNAVLAFPAGVILADCKDTVFKKTENRFSAVLLFSFIFVFSLTKLTENAPAYLADGFSPVTNLLWAFWLILLLRKINIVSPITSFLGSISLEIYLIHGFINNITTAYLDTTSIVWPLVQISLSLLFGWIFSVLFKHISKLTWK